MTAPVRYRTAKADVYGYVAELLAKATDQGALDKQLTTDDRERLLAFLQGFGDIGDNLDLHRQRPAAATPSPRRPPARPGVLLGDAAHAPTSSPAASAGTSPSSSGTTRPC